MRKFILLATITAQPAFAAGHVLDNGRVHVDFADPASGYSTINNDRVDTVTWTNPHGAVTGNMASNGGPTNCGDPLEFFGQAYGDEGDAHPFLVFSGNTSPWQGVAGNALAGRTRVEVSAVCTYTADGITATSYTLSSKPALVNQLTVLRTFTFTKVSSTTDLRVYVPRLPLSSYAAVQWPNAAGAIQTGDAGSCGSNCIVTDWNGTWFAEQTSAGQGLMIIRNPAKGAPALLVFDNDSDSASNNSAVALKLPSGGWLGKYAEKENLCFYDATTWPAARQAAGKLPVGCSVP